MNKYLRRAMDFADMMVKYGTDRYGSISTPLFASTIDTRNNSVPHDFLDLLPGCRANDRSIHGNNLMHDIPLIRAFQYLTKLTGEESYSQAVKDYLDYYMKTCPDPNTGLFPWGEHTFWHFWYERPYSYGNPFGNDLIHDHLRAAPCWFWEEVQKRNPSVGEKFGTGLLGHIWDENDFMYSRHAYLNSDKKSSGTFNFPRHGGFYIVDWACAYKIRRDERFLKFCDRMIDHHKRRQCPRYKYLKLCDSHPHLKPNCELLQVSSLAMSLYDAAALLGETQKDRKNRWQEFACQLAHAFVNHLGNWEEGQINSAVDFDSSQTVRRCNIWQSSYGAGAIAADLAVHALCLFRKIEQEKFLDFAKKVLQLYLQTPLPKKTQSFRTHAYVDMVPAHDFGSSLNLAVDLAEITGKEEYLENACKLADLSIKQLTIPGKAWFTAGSASEVSWYESALDVARVVYSLVRLGAIMEGKSKLVEPDYQWR